MGGQPEDPRDFWGRELVETGDGSHSLYVSALDEQYHSRHGALQEARHVFIEMGWKAHAERSHLVILEVGFGTGLNAWLTYREAILEKNAQREVHYIGLEAYPLTEKEYRALNYPGLIAADSAEFERLHACRWEEPAQLAQNFFLHKMAVRLEDLELLNTAVDLVYFDAFAPNKQPELWTPEIFQQMADLMAPEGLLVTYCAKGDVRRAMQAAGLVVEKLPGPPGKREMLRARKPSVS